MRTNTRPGYTLFQLLVLLAFLALLIGMLLPAVQKTREAATRMQSQNNLKQLGLAVHNYHDTLNRFPPGMDEKGFSGLAQLLPFIEQEALYKKIDFTLAPDDRANAAVHSQRLKVLESNLDPIEQPDPKVAATSYQLVAGSRAALEDNNGVFPAAAPRAITFASIKDGLSNTFMMVETLKGDGGKKAESVARQHVRLKKADLKGLDDNAGVKDFKDGKNIAGDRGASWLEGRFLRGTICLNRTANDDRPDVDCGGAGGLAGPRTLIGGTNLLLGDGSVRFATTKVKLEVWQALATRGGGEEINFSDL